MHCILIMEPNNDDDFQPSKPKSCSYPQTRTKLSRKHQVKLQHRKKYDLEDLYSPVSCSFKRNTSRFEADPVETIPSEQDVESNHSDQTKNYKTPELSKQTKTTANEHTGSNEQNLNPVTFYSSEPTTETCKKLNYNINKYPLNNSATEVIQGAAEQSPVPTHEEAVLEFRNECMNLIECGHNPVRIKASSDDASVKNHCISLENLSSYKTGNALDCVGEVHTSSYEGGIKRQFNCPLCWKTFEKHEAQMLHMKVCASQHNLTTRQLLDAVVLQERQAAERQALGLPDIPTVCTVKKSSRKSGGSGNDSNLQLALALSASIQEAEEHQQLQQDDCLLEAGLGHEVVERQKNMLERFGFKRWCPAVLAPSSSRHKPATKNKNSNAVLMNRTKEERERLITEKVAIILMGEESRPPPAAIDIPHNTQPADGVVDTNKSLQNYQNKSLSLWNMGSVSLSETGFQSHYVTELSKFISLSKVPAGAKLKHLSQIPGRSRTPEKPFHLMSAKGETCSPVSRGTLVQMKTGHKNETEAAEEMRLKTRKSFVSPLIDRSTDRNSLTDMFVGDWKSFLNQKAMSDLTIYVEKDKEIPGHKLVLYVRCRAILTDIVSEISAEGTKETSDMLLWVDVSYKAAMAFLQFLYCGLTSRILQLNEEDFLSVRRLVQRYRVMELLQYLRDVNSVRARTSKTTDPSPNSPQELTPHHKVTHRKKRNFLYPAAASNQCTGSQTAPSPETQMYSEDTFTCHDLSADLIEGSIYSHSSNMRETSNEFRESAESRLCRNVSVSPDLFTEDMGEHVGTSSQEDRSSMDYLLSMINKSSLSQSDSQTNFTEILSEKLTCPAMSSVYPSPPHLQNGRLPVTVIDAEASIPNDIHISCSSQSHDKKGTSPDKDLTCVEHDDDDTQNKCNFLPSILAPGSINSTSPVTIKEQRNVLGINRKKLQQSSQPEEVCNECTPLQKSQQDAVSAESASDGIDFLEHLLSDSSSCKHVERDIKGRVESKRKHTESGPVSEHCSSLTKKVCRDSFEHETVKTFSDMTELKGSDKLNKFEDEVIDLTQGSTDSETAEPQGSTSASPVRECVADTNTETEQNYTSATKKYSEITGCNDLLHRSEESNTTDETSKSEQLDAVSKTGVEETTMSVEQKEEIVLEHRPMELRNMQARDDWDIYDEMCLASVPQIFSQCLSQLISTKPAFQKSLKSRTVSNNCRTSQNNTSRSLSLSPSHPNSPVHGSPNLSFLCSSSPVRKTENISKNIKELPSDIQKSPQGKEVLEKSLLAQLSESVFWRDENEPTLRTSPKQTVPVDHRTPTQKHANVRFSDRVTPPADYSAMKTPQLKKELKKYGLKPSLSKRQAKTMLRYIYDKLHPYITVSDSEDDTQMSEIELSPFKKPCSDTQVPKSPVRKDNCLGTSQSPVRRNIMRTDIVSHRGSPVTQRNTTSQSDVGSDSDDLLLSSQGSTSGSTVSVTEEAFCEELDVFSQEDIVVSQDACSSADLATVVHNFITSDPDLYQKVLLYEPIWIEQLLASLKANNFKFKMNQLMDYLDEQCITFRTAQGQQNRQRKKLLRETKRQNRTKLKSNSSDNKSASIRAVKRTHSDS